MATFCGNCGAPLGAGARFCDKCGTAVGGQVATPSAPVVTTPTATVAAPPTVSPSAPSTGGNTAVKVIFVVLGIFVFLVLLVGGGCLYVAYRVKQRAHQFSEQMGGSVPAYTGSRVPCAMLSAAEASTALGQHVSSFAQRGMSTCEYQYGPGGSKTVAVEYTWQGGAMALRLAHGAMKAVSGMETMTPVDGIGDEAYIVPGGSGFMMRKGDVMVSIDLRANGVSVSQAEAMGRAIAGNL